MQTFKFIFLGLISLAILFSSCEKDTTTDPQQQTSCSASNIEKDIIGVWTSANWSGSVEFRTGTVNRPLEDPNNLLGGITVGGNSYDDKFYSVTSTSITVEFRKCYNCTSSAIQRKYNIINYDCNKITLQAILPDGTLGSEFDITK